MPADGGTGGRMRMVVADGLVLGRRSSDERSLRIGGGMALVAAAVTKLFLFDLGTLDGIFRVVAFVAVGLVLLAIGSGYAKVLAQQDGRERRA